MGQVPGNRSAWRTGIVLLSPDQILAVGNDMGFTSQRQKGALGAGDLRLSGHLPATKLHGKVRFSTAALAPSSCYPPSRLSGSSPPTAPAARRTESAGSSPSLVPGRRRSRSTPIAARPPLRRGSSSLPGSAGSPTPPSRPEPTARCLRARLPASLLEQRRQRRCGVRGRAHARPCSSARARAWAAGGRRCRRLHHGDSCGGIRHWRRRRDNPGLGVDRLWETRLGLRLEILERMRDVWRGGSIGTVTLDDVHEALGTGSGLMTSARAVHG